MLPDGDVLVAGGFGPTGDFLASAEVYDPAAGIWSATGSMSTTRDDPTATLLQNGDVLVAGGDGGPSPDGPNTVLASAELYDPGAGTWTATGSLSTAREFQTATLLQNGNVLVAGGDGGPSPDGSGNTVLASAELYRPSSGTWAATASLSNARVLQTATLLQNGKVLVAGGVGPPTDVTSVPLLASAELYTPVVPTVSGVSPGSGPSSGGTSITITGTGFVSGAYGRDRAGTGRGSVGDRGDERDCGVGEGDHRDDGWWG